MKKPLDYDALFSVLSGGGVPVSDAQRSRISARLDEIHSYQPVVGVMGKTGAGKSSLCNALFGKDVCGVSDVEACTRDQQEVELNTGGRGIKLIDVPGVGESRERDQEYSDLYRDLIPKTDALFWVLKGDDRAFSTDEAFYKNIVRPYIDKGKPFFVVLNQVDKIEPFREWDEQHNCPGVNQSHNIEQKRRYVSQVFDLPLSQVLAVSANERYSLVDLVDELIHALPKEQKFIVLDDVEDEYRSRKARREAEQGWLDTVGDVVGTVVGAVADSAVGRAVGKAVGSVVSVIKGFFFWW
ncbi:MAG: GTP-binding protein [Oceanospirillaceae bacterium]|nr:GTP-binding protein [Oceanospirillaceae bacterium]